MNNDDLARLNTVEDKLITAFEQITATAANGTEVAVQSAALACLVRALAATHPRPDTLLSSLQAQGKQILPSMPNVLQPELEKALSDWQRTLAALC